MKITENVNLSGLIFTIDQDAMLKLQRYLNTIEKYFGNKEEGEEILADIEARIAELFQAQLNKSKEVISLREVAEIIEILGYPEEFMSYGDNIAFNNHNSAFQHRTKIFRDSKDKYLGGVCSGLSYRYNIDVSILRVLFVLSVGLGSVLVYIIFWIVLPEARSFNDNLEMKGLSTSHSVNY